jgi:hypothetical protein
MKSFPGKSGAADKSRHERVSVLVGEWLGGRAQSKRKHIGGLIH